MNVTSRNFILLPAAIWLAGCGKSASDLHSLSNAVLADNTSSVGHMISNGMDPNVNTGPLGTPLMLAVMSRHGDMVRFLISRGADPSLPTSYGVTPLIASASVDCPSCAEALLQSGAKRDDRNKFGETALQVAVKLGHTDVVKILSGNSPLVSISLERLVGTWSRTEPGLEDVLVFQPAGVFYSARRTKSSFTVLRGIYSGEGQNLALRFDTCYVNGVLRKLTRRPPSRYAVGWITIDTIRLNEVVHDPNDGHPSRITATFRRMSRAYGVPKL